MLVSALTDSSMVEGTVEPVRAEMKYQGSERTETSQAQLTLNLLLDGYEDGGHTDYGCLHGGHLS